MSDEDLRSGCHRYCREHYAEGDACSMCGAILGLLDRLEAAEAAVERVRALADAWDDRAWRGHDTAAPFARAVREALEGRQERVEGPQSADGVPGGVGGRSEGCEGRETRGKR